MLVFIYVNTVEFEVNNSFLAIEMKLLKRYELNVKTALASQSWLYVRKASVEHDEKADIVDYYS